MALLLDVSIMVRIGGLWLMLGSIKKKKKLMLRLLDQPNTPNPNACFLLVEYGGL